MTVSVVIPTLNERGNIEPLVAALENALSGIDWEAVFVDDNSSDGTAGAIEEIGRNNPRVHCLKRPGRLGLSSACMDGIGASQGTYAAVMDADLQHDPAALNEMLDILRTQEVDIAIGSRYVQGGSVHGWPKLRLGMSYVATFWAQIVLGFQVKDPLSGFFMVRRSFFETVKAKLSTEGSKILMDIVLSSEGAVIKEIPICFKPRFKGHSKHNWRLVWQNCTIAIDKKLRRISSRFEY